MTVAAIVVAAGRGERLGAGVPKAFAAVGGRPMLEWSVAALRACPLVGQIVVALPDGGHRPPSGSVGVRGGASREESVAAALAAVTDPEADPILVQDAARPLLTPALIEAVVAAALADGVDGAIAAAPVTDTVKRARAAGGEGPPIVSETLERSQLWAVQTPQVFRRTALERALGVSADVLAAATDDAWLVERAGGTVAIVECGEPNTKVTTAADLEFVEGLLAARGGGAAC